MLRFHTAAVLLAIAATPALAQTPPDATGGKEPMSTAPANVGPASTKTLWSPQLPAPAIGDDAPPAAFVKAAQGAIAANRLGEAQEAIERAESRALDRSVRPSKAGQPSRQVLVQQLAAARQALASGDKAGAMNQLSQALANPDASEKDD
jgi:hypothetical protein